MKFQNDNQSLAWLKDHGFPGNCAGVRDFFLSLPPSNWVSSKVVLPSDSGRKVVLAKVLCHPSADQQRLVWVQNWFVWPSSAHLPLVDRFRSAFGASSSLESEPGHLFEASEFEDVISVLIISLMFYWDCFICDADMGRAIFLSHDGFVIVMGPDPKILMSEMKVLQDCKFDVRRLSEGQEPGA